MPSLDGGIKVIESLTVTLCIDGHVKVLHENIKFTMAKYGSRSSPGSYVHYIMLQ